MLRSGMMGWASIMLDTNEWTEQQHAAAKEEIRLYKQELRSFIRDADLYHIGSRPDGIHWDGTEFFDPHRHKGVVYAFGGSTTNEKGKMSSKLAGLMQTKEYRLRFHDRSAPDRTVTGRDLLESGLSVSLPVPNSSELVFIDQLQAPTSGPRH